MQATLDAFSLKALTRALTCLAKYGDELSIYATPECLSFSATNSSKSAYGRFKYEKDFFSRYRLGAGPAPEDEVEEIQNVTGQLMTKSLLSILKHRTVEKSVERCEISIVEGNEEEGEEEDGLESRMVVRLHCKHGVIKTHRLILLTPSALLAPGVPDATNESRLTIGPKGLRELIDHFDLSKSAKADPQLVWTFEDTEVGLHSMESSIDSRGRGQLSTELSFGVEQFDVYDIYESPITIAFHLREFNATIAYADSMSLSIDLRFTDPAAPLFIDVEGDNVETLFVISTSQVQGAPTTQRTGTQAQAMNVKKRERERSASETPRTRKPMKVVQPVDPDSYSNRSRSVSRSASHVPGSMPPPSFLPNRSSYQAAHAAAPASNSPQHSPGPSKRAEPLFLPSSQMSSADEEMLRSTGLGIESMDANELADLLEGDGEEVDFSYASQQPSSQPAREEYDSMQVDEPDSLELVEDGLSATQSSNGVDKTFHPLFED